MVPHQAGWSTVDPEKGDPVDFDPETTPITTDIELWAYMESFVVSYSANATDLTKPVPADQTKTYGKALTLSSEEPARDGYKFIGWGFAAADVEPTYQPGDSYEKDENVTLYAIWENQVDSIIKTGYEKMLGRDPDAEGLAYYEKELTEKRLTGAKMVSNFMNSPEFAEIAKDLSNEEIVALIYETMLGREPSPEEAAYHAANLDQGYSYNAIINCFSQSPEFLAICNDAGIEAGTAELMWRDKNMLVTEFVKRNYRLTLEREAEVDGLEYYCETLLQKYETPQQVATHFVFSDECVARGLSDEEFITMLYNLYMDRAPEAEGLAYYKDLLANGVSREQIDANFGASPEFAEIVKSYGL